MALMFARLAHNFIKNGYYPTDAGTLEGILNLLEVSTGTVNVLDPCAGEGAAIADIAHDLGKDAVKSYAVEYDKERAHHARQLVNHCIQGDLMDTIISRQSFGLLFLNPPYGDLAKGSSGSLGYEGKGRGRLEKLFYQKTLPFLQYEGIMVLVMPYYVLDDEFIGWLTRHFIELRAYKAAVDQFKQVLIIGKRTRQKDQDWASSKEIRQELLAIGKGDVQASSLPTVCTPLYKIPSSHKEVEHFYRVSLEPEQLAMEVAAMQGLWPEFGSVFNTGKSSLRRPVHQLCNWHLALSLAAGAISGVVHSKTGKVFVLKGDTHKEKTLKTEYTEREDGSLAETRILTDKFVPVIKAWDLTPGSATRGEILTIR
ncbi:MAG: DUF6094 domain-containing protein [Saezia sp.]